MTIRTGMGYDVHRLTPNRPLILGGVQIPHTHGLDGHSDADVLTHAIMDALLGAIGKGDIGQHFPDTNAAYKNAVSLTMLKAVAQILSTESWTISNIDATIVAQSPKLAPYRTQMIKNIAKTLGIHEDAVNIKATTEEGLGFTGTGQGMAAHAVCLVYK